MCRVPHVYQETYYIDTGREPRYLFVNEQLCVECHMCTKKTYHIDTGKASFYLCVNEPLSRAWMPHVEHDLPILSFFLFVGSIFFRRDLVLHYDVTFALELQHYNVTFLYQFFT